MRMGEGIDSGGKMVDSQRWDLIDALVDWRDNIVGDLCVSSSLKKETITVSSWSRCFSFEGA